MLSFENLFADKDFKEDFADEISKFKHSTSPKYS